MKKKIIIISISVILLIGISILIMINMNGTNISLEQRLTIIGEEFYEEFYYPPISDKEELGNYEEIGIKINLDNLSNAVYKDINIDDEVDYFKNCNFENTMVTIYPKTPYKISDYEINIKLDC